jgi:hypothetical protein
MSNANHKNGKKPLGGHFAKTSGVKVYVIDHHHLGLALLREKYETIPAELEADLSSYPEKKFWKKMVELKFVHPNDATGKEKSVNSIPKSLTALKDDPYRSLAGFVREEGGFAKVRTPFAEFLWADYFRAHIPLDVVENHFHKALKHALKLAHKPEAKGLPGFIPQGKAGKSFAEAVDPDKKKKPIITIELAELRPTQITVGMRQVEHKQEHLQGLARRPAELLESIMERPIVIVFGPA